MKELLVKQRTVGKPPEWPKLTVSYIPWTAETKGCTWALPSWSMLQSLYMGRTVSIQHVPALPALSLQQAKHAWCTHASRWSYQVSWAALTNTPLPLPPGHSTGDIFRYTCICFAAILSKTQVSIYGRPSGSTNLIPLLLENLTQKTLAVSASASSLCSRRPAQSKVRIAPDHLQVIATNPAKMWYTVQVTPVLPFQNHFPKIQLILIQLKAINICWSAAKYSLRCWKTFLSANQYTTPSLFYLSYST